MTGAAAAGQSRLVISDGTMDPEGGRMQGIANAASPILIGILAPILAAALIDPSLLQHARFMLIAVMAPMMFLTIAIYAYSVLNPGEVSGLIADPGQRTLQVVQSNMFAMRRTDLSFNEISSIRLASIYDRDGYPVHRAEMELQSGQRIGLPSNLGAAEVKALNYVLGLR